MSPNDDVPEVRSFYDSDSSKLFRNTEVFRLQNKFSLDVIRQPYANYTDPEHFEKFKEDLWQVIFYSCRTDNETAAQFRQVFNIDKTAINVDYLILLKDEGRVAGMSSGVFITPSIFYFNTAMIHPQLQIAGIGGLLVGFLALLAVTENQSKGNEDTYLICRTQNRSVASILYHSCNNVAISTESASLSQTKPLFETAARFLHCGYDEEAGIARNVYPDNMPKGEMIKNMRINMAFSKLGPRDACFVTGQLKIPYALRVLSQQITCGFDKFLTVTHDTFPKAA